MSLWRIICLVGLGLCIQGAWAADIWHSSDIGNTGAAGSAGYESHMFVVGGAGEESDGTRDAFHYLYKQLSGDRAVIARVVGVENIRDQAKAGVMIRTGLDAVAQSAFIAVTPGMGISYQWRTENGGRADTQLAAGMVAPYWVKLARSGNSFTAFYSADGNGWTQLGAAITINMTDPVYFGMAVTSQVNGKCCSAKFDNVQITTGVPSYVPAGVPGTPGSVPAMKPAVPGAATVPPANGLLLWLKADAITGKNNGDPLRTWNDASGNGNHATQETRANQPTYVAHGQNGMPAVNFTGANNDFLTFSDSFDGTDNTMTCLAVVNAPTGGLFDSAAFTQGQFRFLNTFAQVFRTSAICNFTTPVALITVRYSVDDANHNALQTYINSLIYGIGTSHGKNPVVRKSVVIGHENGTEGIFNGQLSELLYYNRALSETERQQAENYLVAKYALPMDNPTVAPPIISLPSATYCGPRTMTLNSATEGAAIRYTTDGTTPSPTNGMVYDTPVSLTSSCTLQAIAYKNGMAASTVTAGYYVFNDLPTNGLLLWLKADAIVGKNNGDPLPNWNDASGNGNNAAQAVGANQPTYVAHGQNGMPAVNFTGANNDFLTLPASFNGSDTTMTCLAVVNAPAGGLLDTDAMFPGQLRFVNNGVKVYGASAAGIFSAPATVITVKLTLDGANHNMLITYHNGTLDNSGSSTVQQPVLRNNVAIGHENGTEQAFNGQLSELLYFNRALSDTERQQWEDYLSAKYALK